MPVSTSIDLEKRLVTHALEEDEFTPGDFVEAIRNRLTHPDYQPGLNVLWDFTASPGSTMPSIDLRGMMEYGTHPDHAANLGKVALLVPRPELFPLAKSVETWSESQELTLKAFQDRQAALDWLAGETA